MSAGRQTHHGIAEFHICTRGTFKTCRGIYNLCMNNSTWSLGFEETIAGCWNVNRITPVSVPEGVIIPPQLLSPTPGVRVGNGHQWRVPNPALRDCPATDRARRFFDRGRVAAPTNEV